MVSRMGKVQANEPTAFLSRHSPDGTALWQGTHRGNKVFEFFCLGLSKIPDGSVIRWGRNGRTSWESTTCWAMSGKSAAISERCQWKLPILSGQSLLRPVHAALPKAEVVFGAMKNLATVQPVLRQDNRLWHHRHAVGAHPCGTGRESRGNPGGIYGFERREEATAGETL